MSGIDCTISKSILEKNISALEYYLSDVMNKITNQVKSYVVKMDKIHEQGSLTRILLPELNRLKVRYPQEPDSTAFKDSVELAKLMYEFVTKKAGIDVSPTYIGTHIKMAIVPVARPEKLLYQKTFPHLKFIENASRQGINHFYIVSTSPFIKYAKDLVKDAQHKLNYIKIYEEEYEGIFRGKSTKIFCILLVSRS